MLFKHVYKTVAKAFSARLRCYEDGNEDEYVFEDEDDFVYEHVFVFEDVYVYEHEDEHVFVFEDVYVYEHVYVYDSKTNSKTNSKANSISIRTRNVTEPPMLPKKNG